MDIEDKLTTAEQAELHAARANDRDRGLTAPVFVNSESNDIATLRFAFSKVEQAIIKILPEGRQRALALTNLEDAAAHAYKGVWTDG